MATFTPRSVNEIYTSLIEYKETIPELTGLESTVSDEQTLLDELQSTSKTARWTLYLWVVAYATWVLEQIMSIQILEVEEIRDSSFAGVNNWYADQATKFQYGDTVVVDSTTDYVPQYPTVNTDNNIVAYCAVEAIDGKVILKIRGRDTDILTDTQLSSFVQYISEIKFAGTRTAIQNDLPDSLKLAANVVYTGQANLDTVKTDVEAVINNYIVNIDFNSYLIVNDLEAAVRAVDNVSDFEINTIEGKAIAEVAYTAIIHKYRAFAGYLKIDENYPLSTFITYSIK